MPEHAGSRFSWMFSQWRPLGWLGYRWSNQRQALVVYPRPKHGALLRRPNGEVGDQQVAMSIEGREQRVVVGSWVLEVREAALLAAVRAQDRNLVGAHQRHVELAGAAEGNSADAEDAVQLRIVAAEHRRRRAVEMNQLHRRDARVAEGNAVDAGS